ncbi:MAG: M1 family metallopeptidase [Planctomycetes bacterium]|nr:M1 family metallopeptidase [Planctomycetota bacterium]
MKRIVVYALVLNAALLAGCRHVVSSRQPAAAPPEVDVAEELVDPERRGRQLRGEYGRYRANNDLLYYHLDIRVTPETRSIRGKNTIRFRMLRDDNRIQLDLNRDLSIDKILLGPKPLQYTRELNAVFVDFPTGLKSGREYSIDFYYSGAPKRVGRFGGISFDTDPSGRPWIYTACEGPGSSYWWPGKDQWRDEVESMDISVAVPNQLMNVSNGRFVGKKDLADGYTRWDWRVHYPINSYNVSLNIAAYKHFSDRLGKLSLDFYSLPEDLERAKKQFAQAKPMLKAFKHYFGEYPFIKDGYKIIQVPYSGMEHQTAVAYGNGFTNGYLNKDWTGVGVSMKFDFIIIHESAHEWFGNAVTASDVCDMWIHEGWATYLECMYVERMFGYADALKYVNGYKSKVRNRRPVIAERGIHQSPPGDQYFKGALFLNTLRNVLNDDRKWWALVREVYQDFKYQSIRTEDLVRLFNKRFEADLTPIFDQYLRHAALPVLELVFDEAAGSVEYRWKVDEADFAMPIRVGKPKEWQTITPTAQWQTLSTRLGKEAFKVATDLYFVKITKSLREDEGAK